MAAKVPDSLFKYFSVNEYSIKALESGSVWLSNPSSFNDPYDCGLTIDQIKYIQQEKDYYDAMYPGNGKKKDDSAISKPPVPGWVISVAKADLAQKFKSIGVCSFSEDNLSILMWSHYGDKHQGFCVEYECNNLTLLAKEVCKVRYVSSIPSITIEKYNRYGENEKKEYINSLARYKSNDWGYEKEWRLITDYNNGFYKKKMKIRAVYLGARFDHANKKKIEHLINNTKSLNAIKIHQIARIENSFKLKVMPYYP